MKKLLLIIALLVSPFVNAQDFRIIYNLNGCPSNPLMGAPVFYGYIGIGTINAGTTFDYWSGGFTGTVNPLYPIGNNLWEICVDPYSFQNNLGQTPLGTATIFNITMYFHDAGGSIFTGTCSNGYLQINNPMTGAVSLNPTIVNGFKNCYVGINEIDLAVNSINCTPNPVTNSTVFNYNITPSGKVSLEIFNMLGKKVKTIVSEKQTAGTHSIKWNGNSDGNSKLSNGCYFYTLSLADKKIATNKIIIAR